MRERTKDSADDQPKYQYEIDLVLKAQKGDTKALEAFTQFCLPYIRGLAKSNMNHWVTFDELVHEGTVAVWEKVVPDFDMEKLSNFQGFVARCLQSAISDYANCLQPRGVYRDMKAARSYLFREMRQFENEHGREMTEEELVEFFNRDSNKECTIDDVNRILEFNRPNTYTSSLSDPLYEGSDETKQDRLVGNTPLPDKHAESKEEAGLIRERVKKAVECWGERNSDIYMTYMGFSPNHLEPTLEELGRLYSITKERVRQIVQKCHEHVVAVLKYDPVLKEMAENLE